MYYVNIYTYILDLVLFRIDHNTHVCMYSTYIVVITKNKVNFREGRAVVAARGVHPSLIHPTPTPLFSLNNLNLVEGECPRSEHLQQSLA